MKRMGVLKKGKTVEGEKGYRRFGERGKLGDRKGEKGKETDVRKGGKIWNSMEKKGRRKEENTR